MKGVGASVYEYQIDFGPGYRIYLGPVSGGPIPTGAGGHTSGSQSQESGIRSAVWQRSIGNFSSIWQNFLSMVFFMVLPAIPTSKLLILNR